MGCNPRLRLRVDTRSFFIACAFTGQSKSNKHHPGHNHLQCVLKDTKETSLLGFRAGGFTSALVGAEEAKAGI